MVSRDDDDPGRVDDGPATSSEPRSRVFVWGEKSEDRSFFRRLVDRLRAGNGDSDDGPRVVRPPVSRRGPGPAASQPPREAPVPDLPRRDDGWDPPDLSVEEPPTLDEAPETGAAGESAAAAEVPAAEGHGPGPLYRATLQLLPGRMRPLDPDIVREEIRFVRPSGRSAVVTLGWAEGEPPDHITVNHPSVQDRHARMSFIDRRWHIESLVAGHPVRVNDDAVPAGAEPLELQSGDEVRLGDASFHFLMP